MRASELSLKALANSNGESSCAPRRCVRVKQFAQIWRRPLHLEQFGVTRLDVLALRQHGRRVGLQQLERRQRQPARLVLDEAMERMMRILVDKQLLAFQAEKETLEQPRGIWIRRILEHAGGNDDQR